MAMGERTPAGAARSAAGGGPHGGDARRVTNILAADVGLAGRYRAAVGELDGGLR